MEWTYQPSSVVSKTPSHRINTQNRLAQQTGISKLKKKGRPPIEVNRREKIVASTLNCIRQFGYQETTVAKICADTGLSAGNIHYYFGGKQNLLEEAMRTLLRNIRSRIVTKLTLAVTPLERITAIVESNFDPGLFKTDICITWLHFWAQAPHATALARLERINRIRFQRNLMHELVILQDRKQAENLTRQIIAMVDGLWVEKAQSYTTLSSQQALTAVLNLVKPNLP
ncbi:MAG: TetR/AcrR family bet gene transcriptional repressor [Paraglaciecola sp.]|jgi:TetR/AcrR family transcriptional repressor of bet genes